LTVGGHSLGAAITTFAALELAPHYTVEVYNFGSPRVGNGPFVAHFEKLVSTRFRVTHWRDIVPHLPPTLFDFRHLSREVFYDEPFKVFKICDESGEDKSCADQFVNLSTADHDLYFIPQSC
jgi:hypothetical protein